MNTLAFVNIFYRQNFVPYGMYSETVYATHLHWKAGIFIYLNRCGNYTIRIIFILSNEITGAKMELFLYPTLVLG